MLNYANLNDMEFEALCQDLMSRMLDVPLRRFAPGRDGGVDLTDDPAQMNIVVQVKHYMGSTPAGLIRVLKEELPKVERLQPEQYYICCSKQLSPAAIKGLYEHFADYMDSAGNIVTLTEIDDFLKKPENRDILKKHFKLWLDDTGILEELYNDEIFVDCEVLLADVESRKHRFVQTKAFEKALEVLEKGRTLFIVGDPGVGKSITSQMLVLHHAARGYRVRYTTEVTDLQSLKKSLRDDKNAREIILLDDCFGQAYFEMKSSQSSQLVSLIRYVGLCPNKRLILNSRITIFQEAQARQRVLRESLEQKEFHVYTLDMNQMSDEEKAKILYNHLAFSNIPQAYFEDIKLGLRYWQIIRHPNYNPRVIEFVCSPSRYENVQPDQFYRFVSRHLDDPQQIWADEYDDRLQAPDRILLQTIYSMTTTTVSADLVQRCFDRRLMNMPNIDLTEAQYSRSLQRLNKSFVKILYDNGTMVLSMLNPSVNDFLDNRLQPGKLERSALERSICCEKQIQRLLPRSAQLPYALELLRSGGIDDLIFEEPHHKTRFILRCILAAGLCMEEYRADLQAFFATPYQMGYWRDINCDERPHIISSLEQKEFWECYRLKDFFLQEDHLYRFLYHFTMEESVQIICLMHAVYDSADEADAFLRKAEEAMRELIYSFCQEDAAAYADYVENILYGSDDVSQMEADLDAHICNELLDKLYDALMSLPDQLRHLAEEDHSDKISVCGVEELVADYFASWDDEDPDEEETEADNTGLSAVDAIFLR